MNKVIHGDCLEILKTLPDNSVDAVVTDPPYGLSFMGKKWDYDVPSIEIWQECNRVLKPGGYLLAFAGTRTQHRMAVRIEDAGFEIRDMIAWVYGSGFPKSLNIGKAVDKIQGNERDIIGTQKLGGNAAQSTKEKGGTYASNTDSIGVKPIEVTLTKGTSQWEGWGTALKPALEPITVARKPLGEKTIAENCLKWGVGGINIDGCRVEGQPPKVTGKGIRTKSWREKEDRTDIETETIEWEQPTGRFPANLIHDGSDEVVGLFPQTGKGNGRGAYNYAGKEYDNKDTSMFNGDKPQAPSNFNDSGSAARFFYCAKASKSERNRGCEDKNNHPTVKPIALMEYLVKLVSREGAVVLDPFAGSGSTLLACKNLNREYIGIEREQDYIDIINKRLA